MLCTTVMFAGGPKDGLKTASGFAVIRGNESNLFKVYYKSEEAGNVRLSILDASNNEVFTESFRKTDGFVRPYNFENLPHGEYTIKLIDDNSVQAEKVEYASGTVQKFISVRKLKSEDGKYLVSVSGKGKELITLNIYDANTNNLLHSETNVVKNDMAKLYNVSQVAEHVAFEVVHSNGKVERLDF